MVNRESYTSKRKSMKEPINGIGEITFPLVSGSDNSSDPVIIRVRISGRQHIEPVKQKKHGLALERNEAACKEVDELTKVYVDNMVIKSASEEDMLKDIQDTLDRLRSINIKLNPKKFSFSGEEGPFLGHLITK
ncbi:hypothetical protein Tco_0804573 [Tanacetum coccineum]|uniref:Reverse transcriptase n=1 Tax=Tanacetum coccineum TaxID=301880 RepID=A0ABQ5A4P5_9ASTR